MIVNYAGFYDPLLDQFERALAAGFESEGLRRFFAVTGDPVEAVALCEGEAAGDPPGTS